MVRWVVILGSLYILIMNDTNCLKCKWHLQSIRDLSMEILFLRYKLLKGEIKIGGHNFDQVVMIGLTAGVLWELSCEM